ncbi:MAG: aminoglycoside phosphotransferase family protein [Verrucomicrobiota bacterium]
MSSNQGTPKAETEIDEALIRQLLEEQHPDLADLPLHRIDAGWDNEIYRLGNELAVRMPRRELGAEFALIEQKWLPQLAEKLPILVPAPVRVGSPCPCYPWAWSVVPWFEGETAAQSQPGSDAAETIGAFLRALHQTPPKEAPRNEFRCGPLKDRDEQVENRIAQLREETSFIDPRLIQIWRAGTECPVAAELTWLHGDLHPKNVLIKNHAISAILDWGDMTAGDPALDLASIWMLFGDPAAQLKGFNAYGSPDSNTLARSKAWAVYFGVLFLGVGVADHSSDDLELGRRILNNLAD